jgi:hypothetical protein
MRKKKETQAKRVHLPSQHEVLRDAMLSAAQCDSWLTLRELAGLTHYGEASISAQLRHLRKPRYGAFVVDKQVRRYAGVYQNTERGAVWEYRLSRNVRAEFRRDGRRAPLLRSLTYAAISLPE